MYTRCVMCCQIEKANEQVAELRISLQAKDDEFKALKAKSAKQASESAAELESLKKRVQELSAENAKLRADVDSTVTYKVRVSSVTSLPSVVCASVVRRVCAVLL